MKRNKTKRQLLKAKLLPDLRKKMLERDGNKCVRCNKTTTLQMSHVYPKGRYRKMEFELDNIKTLCVGCHLYWWHKHPIEAGEWFRKKYPERAKKLKALSQRT